MACIVKLKDNMYTSWCSVVDRPGPIMTLEEVREYLSEAAQYGLLMQGHEYPVDKDLIEKECNRLLEFLKLHGTTDSIKTVDVNWVVKYNQAGDNYENLTLEEIIKKFTKQGESK